MFKFQYAINLGLATLLTVPAVTLGVRQNDSLELTLRRTMQALEELAAIEGRLQERSPSAIAQTLQWTEPPLATPESNPGARDELLVELRSDVERLRQTADTLVNQPLTVSTQSPELGPVGETVVDSASRPATTGFDDSLRRRLGSRTATATPVAPLVSAPTPTTEVPADKKTNLEGKDYSADSIRLGRAYYRQGRYDLALTSFESERTDSEAQYWRARCLEKLGKTAEALVAYADVIAMPGAGFVVARAQEDLDFLQWRVEFEKSHAGSGAKKP